MECTIKIVNWNIGGAKYLETKDDKVQAQLQRGLDHLVDDTKPHVICLQEFTQFAENGMREDAIDVVRCPKGYKPYLLRLIDTDRHSHQGKWSNVREKGGWPLQTYFSQGNAIFVREDVSVFPVWSLPSCGATFVNWRNERTKGALATGQTTGDSKTAYQAVPEDIILQTGFYRGTRDTEPRAATVLHLVIDRPLRRDLQHGAASPLGNQGFRRPIDVFIVNTHLTTLTNEREGIPAVDAKASRRRLGQLDILFDDVISEYNRWAKDDFRIRGKHPTPLTVETHDRCAPVWILCGDFNFTRQSAEYRYIKDRNFMDIHFDTTDAYTKAVGRAKEPSLTLDYVFAGPAFEALDPKRTRERSAHQVRYDQELTGSDHYPICAALSIDQVDDVDVRCKTCRESQTK
jgi:endonuclease/exonuclease/phosphatase family protein